MVPGLEAARAPPLAVAVPQAVVAHLAVVPFHTAAAEELQAAAARAADGAAEPGRPLAAVLRLVLHLAEAAPRVVRQDGMQLRRA